MKHVHHDVIVEWAKGKQIEYYSVSGWEDCPGNDPVWAEGVKYRVKPEIVRYRCYRRNTFGVDAVSAITECGLFTPEDVNGSLGFIEWIHMEWQEYEVKS